MSEIDGARAAPPIERAHVHQVYDAIATHFSATRFAKWPKVAAFLDALPPGALVLDAGCGNGKYLGYSDACLFVGCDISPPLAAICGRRGFDVAVADAVRLPFRGGAFDAAISIAVLHHLSTAARRRAAVAELAACVRPGGRLLVTVWAREQEDGSLVAKWTPLTERYADRWVDGGDGAAAAAGGRDWPGAPSCGQLAHIREDGQEALSGAKQAACEGEDSNPLLTEESIAPVAVEPRPQVDTQDLQTAGREAGRAGDVAPDVALPAAEGTAASDGRGAASDSAAPAAGRPDANRSPADSCHGGGSGGVGRGGELLGQEFLVPWHLPYHRADVGTAAAGAVASGLARRDDKKGALVYNRYYHVFRAGELERLAAEVPGVRLVEAFYDKSNWCIILERTE